MSTKKQYVEYLVSTPKNCTCTYLAEHLEEVSHDVVNDFLHQKHFLPREVWQLVKDRIEDSQDAFLLVDDSVQDKRYSRFIELVRTQYSGNEHRVIKGIGVVNLGQSAGKDGDFYPIDYRVYAPDVDGKTKNNHFQEMFVNALDLKHLQARTLLFDGWYASAENLKLIHRRKRIFFTTLKSNRLVSLSKEVGYCHLEEIEWTAARLAQGVLVKLKEVPFYVRLFKLVAPDGDIDWVITNDLAETVTAPGARETSDVRWQVEEYHKALKTGLGAERLQFETAARLFAAVASMSVVALRLVGLREQVRCMPDRPAETAGLAPLELAVLHSITATPVRTVREVALAIGRLGGHLNRRQDGLPGWQTLWLGMKKLALLVQGIRLARQMNEFG